MKNANIIRALKNRNYSAALSDDQRAQVGQHPSGIVELDDSMLGQVAGGSILNSVGYHCSGSGGGGGTPSHNGHACNN